MNTGRPQRESVAAADEFGGSDRPRTALAPPRSWRAWRHRGVSILAAGIALLCAAWLGTASGFGGLFPPLSGLNGLLYDVSVGALQRLRPARSWSSVAVILIDQPTLMSPPWSEAPRALQQPALGKLGSDILALGARTVGYDLVVAFDPTALAPRLAQPPRYDAPFTELLTMHPDRVVLGADVAVAPAQRYAALLDPASLGVIDLQAEGDGVIRSVATRLRLPNGDRALSFASALAGADRTLAPTASRAFILPPAPIAAIPHLSGVAVERCLASEEGRSELSELLSNRSVIVGAGLAGEDEHRGPDRFMAQQAVSKAGEGGCRGDIDPVPVRAPGRVPGAFVQAAALEGLLAPGPVVLASAPARVIVDSLIAALVGLLWSAAGRFSRLPARRSRMFGTTLRSTIALAGALAFLITASVALAVSGLLWWHVWFPIGTVAGLLAVLGTARVLALAVRRDLAVADLRIAFGRWLPPPVIEAMLGNERTLVHGEERVITVLIADLKNFTGFCALHRTNPERIVSALNRRFSVAQAIIDRHRGCLDKFDGDAVIAFWNAIEVQPDHARRAMMAALEIADAAPSEPDGSLAFKCAVATGVAFVGRYGSDVRSNFSAIGEPMNLAARLDSLCRPHGLDVVVAASSIAAEEMFAGAIASPFTSTVIGEARLKGFPDPVTFHTIAARPRGGLADRA